MIGWAGQLTGRFQSTAQRRLGGVAAVLIANIAIISALASGDGFERNISRQVMRPDFYFILSPTEPEPEPATSAEARPSMPPSSRPVIVTPERPVFRDDDEESGAITLPRDYAPGLRGLVERDPCDDPRERIWRDDCPADLPGATADARIKAIEDARRTELAQAFGPQCTQLHGCLPMPDKTLGGMNPVAPRSPMSGGAARLGGINDLVGRLPPPNWYHVDPGFGD